MDKNLNSQLNSGNIDYGAARQMLAQQRSPRNRAKQFIRDNYTDHTERMAYIREGNEKIEGRIKELERSAAMGYLYALEDEVSDEE